MCLRLIAVIVTGWLGLLGDTLLRADESPPASEPATALARDTAFARDVAPFLAKHCYDCHSGEFPEADLALDRFTDSAEIEQQHDLWERVLRMIEHREMPPEGEPQPGEEELIEVGRALRAELDAFDCSGQQRPGRVTIRRLNRVEYDNTIRDLVGVDFRPADDFPSDDVGHGFDNIADVLSMSPILMDKYLAAAESVVDQAFEDSETRGRIEVHSAERSDRSRSGDWRERLQMDVTAFARRAFRRPLTEAEVDRLMTLATDQQIAHEEAERARAGQDSGGEESGDSNKANEALRTACVAVLASPHFLFRIERDPASPPGNANPDEARAGELDADGDIDGDVGEPQPPIRALNDHEIASRLSYFLWSSMPDERLFSLADEGRLQDPDRLRAEVERMLADPKSRALVNNFGGQWLQLRDLATLSPDPERFPDFDEELRGAMRGETERFFEAVIREDRSVLEFLSADFSFINQRLAEHYGIEDVRGEGFQQVTLPPQRRGVLTHASVLMLTSNPTRTSPVKRGQWILDNVLGEPPPPPPDGVEELSEDDETLGSLRERMEQHRANPSCAVCHRQMDALGFGLENFDAVGAWRDRDGRFEIDPAGELPGDQRFSGPAELMQLLADERRDEFCRCLTEKLLTYALGRGLSAYDRCAVNSILDQLADDEFRFSALVKAVVTSDPFLYRELAGAE